MSLVYAGIAVFSAARTTTPDGETIAVWKVWVAALAVAWGLALVRSFRFLMKASGAGVAVEVALNGLLAVAAAMAVTAALYAVRGRGPFILAKPKH